MNLRPITRAEARQFIAEHHRHNNPPAVTIFQVGAEVGGKLVGVVTGARPVARKLCDGSTLEISRVATNGHRNACSMLYGAALRAGKALGYTRFVTYTLQSEPGSSLKASGWVEDVGYVGNPNPAAWATQKAVRSQPVDLFGNRTTPNEPKRRWWQGEHS